MRMYKRGFSACTSECSSVSNIYNLQIIKLRTVDFELWTIDSSKSSNLQTTAGGPTVNKQN